MAVKTQAGHRIIEKLPKLFLLIGCLALDYWQYHGRIGFLCPSAVDRMTAWVLLGTPLIRTMQAVLSRLGENSPNGSFG